LIAIGIQARLFIALGMIPINVAGRVHQEEIYHI
jgi:hypothetical protein